MSLLSTFITGLSPRVRGNRVNAGEWRNAGGSIPACAGEPGGAQGAAQEQKVYPRVCGGTWETADDPSVADGLSPRVRGNRV